MAYTFPAKLTEVGNSFFVLIPKKIVDELGKKKLKITIEKEGKQ